MTGAIDVFTENGTATVSSGGTTAPAGGTVQSWTAAGSTLPSASSAALPPTQYKVADPALPSETILVTNTSGTTLTVTRGAEGTAPVAHAAGFTIQQVISAQSCTAFRVVDWLDVVTDFGADPTGGVDATSAFQNAINALPGTPSSPQGGTVYVPGGTYKISAGQISVVAGLHLMGAGYEAVTLNCSGSGSYAFNLDPAAYSSTNHVEDLQITGLTVSATGMDIFWGANIVRCKIRDNYLVRNSAAFAVMNVSGSTGSHGTGYISECEFANKEFANGNTTIESWHIDESATTLRANDNVWHGGGCKIWTGTGSYWLRLIGDGSTLGSKHNTFRDLIFENSGGTGGHIWLQNTSDGVIDNISCEDLSSGTVSNPLVLLSTFGGSAGCQGMRIRSYSRRSGSGISGSIPDIKLDSNCNGITIDSPSESSGGTALTVDLQTATNVALTGAWPASASVINAGSSQTLTNNATIGYNCLNAATRVTTGGGPVTGIILAPGSWTSQPWTIVNKSAGSVTFAASGTSNVADGAGDVIAAGTAATFVWDTPAALWYRAY